MARRDDSASVPPTGPDASSLPTEPHPGAFPSLPEGRVLDAPGYELLKWIGSGSYGSVYQAREHATGKMVAIKFFHSGAGARWQALLEEVRQHARFDAVRGIVDLKQVVSTADPPYYVMAYADGGSLAKKLETEKRLPMDEALNLFHQAAEALAYVHAKGICHCDLKPGNLLLDARGQLLLADFGQAQPSTEGSPALGTFFFMPPEQADLHSTIPDPCWDVYALGAVLYYMLTGEIPRYHPSIQQELERLVDLPTRLARYREWLRIAPPPTAHRTVPGVDADLARILDRCLRIEPRQRFADAGEVLAALRERKRRRQRRPLLLFGLAVSLLTVFLTAFTESRANTLALDTYERDLTTQLLESNRSSASLIAGAVERQLLQRLQRVTRAVTPSLFQATQRADRLTLEKYLKQLMTTEDGQISTRFAETTVTNQRGELLAMVRLVSPGEARTEPALQNIDPRTLKLPYPHFSWRDWFSAKGDRYEDSQRHHPPMTKPHISDPYASSLDPEGLFISISAPIRDSADASGKVIGVLEAAVLMSELGRWIRDAHISRDGSILMLDKRRHAVFHTAKDVRPKRGQPARKLYTSQEDAERFPLQRGMISPFVDPIDGDEQLAGYARMNDDRIGWVVVVQHQRRIIVGPINALRDRLGWVGWQSFAVVLLLVGGLWAWLLMVLRRLERGLI